MIVGLHSLLYNDVGYFLYCFVLFLCMKLCKNYKYGKALLTSRAVAKAMAQKEPTDCKIQERAAKLQVRGVPPQKKRQSCIVLSLNSF